MNRRRILIIALGLLVLALVGVGAWYLRDTITGGGETDGTLPQIGGDFSQVPAATSTLEESMIPTDDVHAYHAFADGTLVVVHGDGTVSRVEGKTVTALSATPVAGFASASISADGSKVLVLTGAQPRSQVNVFDVKTASWRVVPGTFRDASWGPSGTLLATLTPDEKTGKTAVGIYDAATGKTVQTLAVLALGDVSVSWPAASTVIVADKPNARSVGSAWAIDTKTKRVTLAARGKQGFAAAWDPAAKVALAFQANPYGRGGSMRLISGAIEQAQLAFATVPDKCAFASLQGAGSSTTPYVICGVPRDQDAFQRYELPDAWYRKEVFTDDVLVGVNLDTREVDFTIAPPVSSDVTDVQIVGTAVYFTDRATHRLFTASI